MHNLSVGNQGEQIARRFCEKKKWRVIHTNWRHKKGELDIVAQDGGCTVFIEVKTRSSTQFGLPEESITPTKQRMLRQTISAYIAEHHTLRYRFDVISILLSKGIPSITHLQDVLLLTSP